MSKILQSAALALLLPFVFTACSDDDNTPDAVIDPVPTPATAAYVVNQGNMYGGVAGSIDCIDLESGTTTSGLFFNVNAQALGDSPQQAVRYGNRIYLPVYGSNLLWVVNASTLRIVASVPVNAPEAVCGAGEYVFVAGNDGIVTRIDTLNCQPSATVAVGPNPAGIVAVDSLVYVSISDGYNYANNYENGKKLAVVHARTMQVERNIAVGLNPGALCANSRGEVFVLTRGNYFDVLPKVQKVSADGDVKDYCDGSLITLANDCLYVVNASADYANNTSEVSLTTYNTLTDEALPITLPAESVPGWPNAIDVEPVTGQIFISSDKGPSDYDKSGYVYRLAPWGELLQRYDAGIHPFGVVFK